MFESYRLVLKVLEERNDNIGQKLNETQLVFLYLFKRKKEVKKDLKRRLPSVFL